MQFVHRENESLVYKGEKIRHSRSVAVEAVLFFHCLADQQRYVPLIHRGTAPDLDSPDTWALPGGYLDWDEDAFASVCRECREETGLDILALEGLCTNREEAQQPFGTHSYPYGKQNVVLWFGLDFAVDALPSLQPQVDSSEIQSAQWYPVQQTLDMELAFGHEKLIAKRWERIVQHD